ncbi:MAG: hypothetical protein Q8941_22610 [Bacteroidota bacterium]|nr:hypothetical protein [Bacteroidota bacterium]
MLLLVWAMVYPSCHSTPAKKAIHYEVLKAAPVNDSLSAHRANYKDDFKQWKAVYEQCMHDTLFPNAIYLGLQNNIGIGSISNQTVQNVNREITVLDTSGKSDIFNILAVINSANCFSKINLNNNLQDSFYNELIRNLKNAGDYSYLSGLVDTSRITFNIGTLIDYTLRKDSLVSLLQRTTDSSLLYFRQILTTPGNVLLVRAGMIFGFDAQFRLKKKLSPEEAVKLKGEVFFKLGDHGEKGSIQMLPDQNVKVVISRNYTVFGEFYSFR